jgi:hypothetical protein
MLASPRANPLPELEGPELVRAMLAEIEEEEALSRALGIDLTPPAPSAEHAPHAYPPLAVWLSRSEEIHAHREAGWRADRLNRLR